MLESSPAEAVESEGGDEFVDELESVA